MAQARTHTFVECIELGATGLSGTLPFNARPDLQRLKVLSDARAYDEVWVQRQDRLTRNEDPLEVATVLSMIWRAEARIVEAIGGETDPSTLGGKLTFMVKGMTDGEEAKKIVDRTMKGRRKKATEGYFQGRAPYARTWNKQTKTWGVDEGKAKIYRRLFTQIIAGSSTHKIAAELNREKVPPPRAGDHHGETSRSKGQTHQGWTGPAIRLLILNRSAVGETSSMGIPMRCAPIVDEATWARAKAALKENRSGRPATAPVLALLRRIAVCGMCGSPMWVRPAQNPYGPTRYYYACRHSRTARTPECRKNYNVIQTDKRATEEIIRALEARALPEVGRSSAEEKAARVKVAKVDLGKISREIDRILGMVQHAPDEKQARLHAVMDGLRKEYDEAKETLAQAEAIKVSVSETIADRAKRAELAERARDATPDQLRDLVTRLFGLGDIAILEGGAVEIRATSPRS
jgi:DNA invertase Pin-like site-specific DNA recombinase